MAWGSPVRWENLDCRRNAYLLSLVMFNTGVELGQLTIILPAYFLLGKWFGNKSYYRRLIHHSGVGCHRRYLCYLDRSTDLTLIDFQGPEE